jgi:thymidine phosphorylase
VASIACEQVGIACAMLGGGREKITDKIDHAVGIVLERKRGDQVSAGQPLCRVHYNSDARLAEARALLEASFTITAQPPSPRPLILQILGE